MAINNYQPNLESMQQYLGEENEKAARRNGEGTSVNWWSIPQGMSSIRILPPWDPTGRVALQVFMHPIEYQASNMKYKKYNWTCVSKTFDKSCKICEALQNLSNAGVDVSKYEANRRHFYMNALIMHDPRHQKNPQDGVAPGTHVLMRAPKTIYDWVISQITNPMVGDITSLTNGIDIYVTKEGTGLGTSYTPTLSPNGRTAVPQEYLSKIESLYNLDEIFSTGWDDETLSGLITHLNQSANSINNNMASTVNNMAGYTTPPNQGIPQSAPVIPQQPPVASPVMPTQQVPNTGGIAPSPYAEGSTPKIPPVSNEEVAPFAAPSVPYGMPAPVTPAPAQPATPAGNAPKCYGQYNPSQVSCVVCPFEVPCSQTTQK